MDTQNLNQTPSQNSQNTKSKYWKFILGFLVLIFLAFFGYPFLRSIYYQVVANKTISDYKTWEAKYLDAIKNDIYGGKTPQETYEMFKATLQDGDILNAAKFYLRDEDRISAYKKFDQLQKDGKLNDWINNLPQWSQMKEVAYWDPDGKEFQYDYTQKDDYIFYDVAMQKDRVVPAGKYKASIIFELGDSKLWKINQL